MNIHSFVPYEVGQTVFHRKFGSGTILDLDANGAQVQFKAERKRVVLTFLSPNPFPFHERADPAAMATRPLETVTAASFAGKPRPRREFLDEGGLIPLRNLTLLYGDGGTGKSLLALQLACAVTVTGLWIGASTRRGKVLYFSAEDDEAETHIRLAEIAEADGWDLATAGGLHIALMAGKDCILAAEDGRSALLKWTALYERVRLRIADLRPNLLILDNLADAFAGNENAKTLARQFLGRLRGLAIEFDCAIVILAHPSQSGMSTGAGTSGNTAWNNSVRSRLYFYREIEDGGIEANPDRRILDTKKANYGPVGSSIPLEWQSGRFIAIDRPAVGAGVFAGISKIAKAERVFLEMVRRFNRDDRPVSSSKGPNYAPTLFARHPLSEGVKSRELANAMETLLENREIQIVHVGPPSKLRQNIVPRPKYGDLPADIPTG